MIVLDKTHKSHNNTPSNHDDRKPQARAQLLENQVAGDFKSRISEEENGQAPVILVRREFQVIRQTLDLGVSDVSTWVRG